MAKVSVLGAGAWGVALGILLAENGNDVIMWTLLENEAKMLKIGKLEFISDGKFEFNVSKYSITQLDKAQHTDELVSDGDIHLRIDYKNSGIGSGSCGPLTEEPYRLSEKKIDFAFSVKPV